MAGQQLVWSCARDWRLGSQSLVARLPVHPAPAAVGGSRLVSNRPLGSIN
jgi:hypothetical protein